jgi:CRP/FNR family transcriptional regulator
MDIPELINTKFPSLYDQELKDEIASVGKLERVKAGNVILEMGNYIKSIPLVVEGSIKVMREDSEGNEILLYYVDASNTCAMSLTCCLSYSQSKIRAIAEEDTLLILIPVNLVEEWMQKYSSWKNFIMLTYSARFEELLRTIDLIAFKNMDIRLIHFLKEKSEIQKSNDLHITHQEIAYSLNSSREAISRLLKQLEKIGMIALHRNRIEILNLDKKIFNF